MSPEKKEIDYIERDRIITDVVEAVCDPSMIAHCRDPYPNHPKGCPNWGKKEGCPPHVRYFPNVYSKDVRVVAIKFDFAKYLEMRRRDHPDWTERALRNPLYWQGHVRHELSQFYNEYAESHPENRGEIEYNPEAMGVNLFATCEKAGIILEYNPEKFVYKVALIVKRLSEQHS